MQSRRGTPPRGPRRRPRRRGEASFSLIEVAFALGICTVGIVSLIGLFSTGIKAGRESQDEIQAANLVSYLVAVRSAAPTNAVSHFPIPALAARPYADLSAGDVYIGLDGSQTNATAAAYRLVCRSGTNALTGPGLAQLYVMLSWPPSLDPAHPAAKRYDLLTYIPLP